MSGLISIFALTEIYYIVLFILCIFSFIATLILLLKFRSKPAIIAAIPFGLLCIDYFIRINRHYYIDQIANKLLGSNVYEYYQIFVICISHAITLIAVISFFISIWKLLLSQK